MEPLNIPLSSLTTKKNYQKMEPLNIPPSQNKTKKGGWMEGGLTHSKMETLHTALQKKGRGGVGRGFDTHRN